MLRVGLTGGIGCGKSTVANLFRKLYGVPVFDADEIAKEVTNLPEVKQKIVQSFGENVIKNGTIDREQLRKIIFANKEAKQTLEAIIHPLVWRKIDRLLENTITDYCITVVPLLFETNNQHRFDRVLVVDCDENQQIDRVQKRDELGRSTIVAIMGNQIPRAQRLAMADDVIQNTGDLDFLKEKLATLHQKYLALNKTRNNK